MSKKQRHLTEMPTTPKLPPKKRKYTVEVEGVVYADQLAEHFGLSRRYFVEVVSKSEGFPEPVLISVWSIIDINNWLRRHSELI